MNQTMDSCLPSINDYGRHPKKYAKGRVAEVYEWGNVKNDFTLSIYYKQRLGPSFSHIPAVVITNEQYRDLVIGDADILTSMCSEDPEAAFEVYIGGPARRPGCLLLTFSLDSSSSGTRFCNFVSRRKCRDWHVDFLQDLRRVSKDVQSLHRQWKKNGGLFYSIAIPGRKVSCQAFEDITSSGDF